MPCPQVNGRTPFVPETTPAQPALRTRGAPAEQSYVLCAIKRVHHWPCRFCGGTLVVWGPPGWGRCAGPIRRGGAVVEGENPRRVWKSRRKRIEGKTQYVRVSMSESERAALMVLEQQTGLSPSALMVEAVFGSADPVAVQLRRNQLVELLAMRRLMATISNNVNQIARHANSTGEVLPETVETMREARRFSEAVLAKIEELIP